MKKINLILIIFSINFAFSNSPIQTLPKAIVSEEIVNESTTRYTFKSNYIIDAYKAPMLEGRMLNRYSEIFSIEINAETQIIIFTTPTIEGRFFLGEFVQHFKYSGYEIH
jgi:hypothetical protein